MQCVSSYEERQIKIRNTNGKAVSEKEARERMWKGRPKAQVPVGTEWAMEIPKGRMFQASTITRDK